MYGRWEVRCYQGVIESESILNLLSLIKTSYSHTYITDIFRELQKNIAS